MALTLAAEWHQQSAVLLTWPHKETDWLPWLNQIEQVYIDIVKAISQHQVTVIACHDIDLQHHIHLMLQNAGIDTATIRTFVAPCNDTWARDHGPITLVDEQGETCILDFTFNAWGSKYRCDLDNLITTHFIQQPFCQLQSYQNVDLVLEGGSIESDGNGTIMTTETCLLNPNRNNGLDKQALEDALKEVLGAKQVVWLKHGHLPGDDTDAHIDTLARFCPNGIVYVTCDNETDPSYQALKAMEQELAEFKKVTGTAYKLYPLPSPDTILNKNGEPLPATYANYLIINEAVLVPVYGVEQDELALKVVGDAYPNRKIVPINCRTVIEQFGSLHCLTMQLPCGLIK